MPPIGEVSAGIAILGSAMAGLKKLREMAKQRRDSEITDAVTELQGQFLELQGSYSQVLHELAELKRAHRDLEESTRAKREDFEWRDEVYWKRVGGDGPFCPSCLDGSLKQVRIASRNGLWVCPVCKHKQDSPERIREWQAHQSRPRRVSGPWWDR